MQRDWAILRTYKALHKCHVICCQQERSFCPNKTFFCEKTANTCDNNVTPMTVIRFIYEFHSSLKKLCSTTSLHWNKSSFIPSSTLCRSLFEESALVPLVFDRSYFLPSHYRQFLDWLIDRLYYPGISNANDLFQLRIDLKEMAQTMIELVSRKKFELNFQTAFTAANAHLEPPFTAKEDFSKKHSLIVLKLLSNNSETYFFHRYDCSDSFLFKKNRTFIEKNANEKIDFSISNTLYVPGYQIRTIVASELSKIVEKVEEAALEKKTSFSIECKKYTHLFLWLKEADFLKPLQISSLDNPRLIFLALGLSNAQDISSNFPPVVMCHIYDKNAKKATDTNKSEFFFPELEESFGLVVTGLHLIGAQWQKNKYDLISWSSKRYDNDTTKKVEELPNLWISSWFPNKVKRAKEFVTIPLYKNDCDENSELICFLKIRSSNISNSDLKARSICFNVKHQ